MCSKVDGKANPADMFTEFLSAQKMKNRMGGP